VKDHEDLVFDRLVGLADSLLGSHFEPMLLIAHIREKQGANQDKSRIGLKIRSLALVGEMVGHTEHDGRSEEKGLTQNDKGEKYFVELKDP
jgi:hypothetical protein